MAGGGAPAGAMEVATGAAGLLSWLPGAKRTEADRVLGSVQREIEAAWRDWRARSDHRDPGALAGAVASFEEVVPLITIRQSDVAASHLDADAIARAVLRKAAEARPGPYADDPRNPDACLAREFLLTVVRQGYDRLLDEPDFMERLAPNLWRELFGQVGRVVMDVGQVRDDTATILSRQDEMKAMLLRALEERGEAGSARASGVTDEALIALASRIADDVANVDRAMVELEAAVEVAVRVQEEGHHGSNLGLFVDEVLRRTAALSARGEYDAVAEDLEASIAEADAQARTVKSRLLERAIDNDRLRRDPEAAARHMRERFAVDDPSDLFSLISRKFLDQIRIGRDRGSNYDLEIGTHLGEHAASLTADPVVIGKIKVDLGITRDILAWQAADRKYYKQAISDFGAAMGLLPYASEKEDWLRAALQRSTTLAAISQLDDDWRGLSVAAETLETLSTLTLLSSDLWAGMHNNLANIYVEMGTSPSGLQQKHDSSKALWSAVETYNVSLETRKIQGKTSEWGMIQNNLGRAYLELSEFEAAVAASESALMVRTKEKEPLRWAMIKHNLAQALLGWTCVDDDLTKLDLAEGAAQDALSERQLDRSPMEWAMTTMTLGNIALVRFTIIRGAPHLDRAEELVGNGMKAFRAFEAKRHLQQGERLLNTISLLRKGLKSP